MRYSSFILLAGECIAEAFEEEVSVEKDSRLKKSELSERVGLLERILKFVKRRWNMIPNTRDVPWANYLLFALGGGSLAVGLKRAFRDPAGYRGKVSRLIAGALSVVLCG